MESDQTRVSTDMPLKPADEKQGGLGALHQYIWSVWKKAKALLTGVQVCLCTLSWTNSLKEDHQNHFYLHLVQQLDNCYWRESID